MDPDIARILAASSPAPNPYASPSAAPQAQQTAEPVAPRQGSLAIIIPGFLLLLVGYLTSNLFAVGDLYGLGYGPGGEPIPSPLAEVFKTPMQQGLFYAITAAATIAGCIMIGSQNFNPMAAVMYMLCPIVGLVFLVAMPLRVARRWAIPIATIYLGLGTCLAGAGVLRLINLYGQPDLTLEPLLASLMTEIGYALLFGGLLKLWLGGALTSAEPVANAGLTPARS